MKNKKVYTFKEQLRNEHIKNVFTSVLVVSCLICVVQAAFYLIKPFLPGLNPDSVWYFYSNTFYTYITKSLSFFIPFYLYNKAVGDKVRNVFNKNNRVPFYFYPLGIIAVYSVSITFQKLSSMFISVMIENGYILNESIQSVGSNIYQNIFFIFMATIIPSFFYEIVFRGIILKNLKKESYVAAIILSSLIAAFSHISFETMPYMLASGFVLGWLYVKSESISLTIYAQLFTNAALSVMMVLKNNLQSHEYSKIADIIVLIAPIAAIISIALLIIFAGFTKKRDENENPLKINEICRGIFASFAFYSFIFITVFQFFFYYIDKPEPEEEDNKTNKIEIFTDVF